jgi:hypothetical protein
VSELVTSTKGAIDFPLARFQVAVNMYMRPWNEIPSLIATQLGMKQSIRLVIADIDGSDFDALRFPHMKAQYFRDPEPGEKWEGSDGFTSGVAVPRPGCSDDCVDPITGMSLVADGRCEDGGVNSISATCAPGTDCSDCMRFSLTTLEYPWEEYGVVVTWFRYMDWLAGFSLCWMVLAFSVAGGCACSANRRIRRFRSEQEAAFKSSIGESSKRRKKRKSLFSSRSSADSEAEDAEDEDDEEQELLKTMAAIRKNASRLFYLSVVFFCCFCPCGFGLFTAKSLKSETNAQKMAEVRDSKRCWSTVTAVFSAVFATALVVSGIMLSIMAGGAGVGALIGSIPYVAHAVFASLLAHHLQKLPGQDDARRLQDSIQRKKNRTAADPSSAPPSPPDTPSCPPSPPEISQSVDDSEIGVAVHPLVKKQSTKSLAVFADAAVTDDDQPWLVEMANALQASMKEAGGGIRKDTLSALQAAAAAASGLDVEPAQLLLDLSELSGGGYEEEEEEEDEGGGGGGGGGGGLTGDPNFIAFMSVGETVIVNGIGNFLTFVITLVQSVFDIIVVMTSISLLGQLLNVFKFGGVDISLPRLDVNGITLNLFLGIKLMLATPVLTFWIPWFDVTLRWFLEVNFVMMRLPTLSDCRGIYGILSLATILILMWPLFLVLQYDILSKFKVKYKKLDWHAEPRFRGGRMEQVYLKLQSSPKGRLVWKGWLKVWVAFCEGFGSSMNVAVQLMVLAMTTRLIELFRMLKRTKEAEDMVAAGVVPEDFVSPSKCGQIEAQAGLEEADKVVAMWVFLIWSCLVFWLVFFFYVPMLFASRETEDWHMASFLKSLIRPEAKRHLCCYLVQNGGYQDRYTYYFCSVFRIPLVCKCCCRAERFCISCCDAFRRCYRISVCGGAWCPWFTNIEFRMTNCWQDVKWLDSPCCILPGARFFVGLVYDMLINMIAPVFRPLHKLVFAILHRALPPGRRYHSLAEATPVPRRGGSLSIYHIGGLVALIITLIVSFQGDYDARQRVYYNRMDATKYHMEFYRYRSVDHFFEIEATVRFAVIVLIELLACLGVAAGLFVYGHMVLEVFTKCWGRLFLMTCGVWTEELLLKYRVLFRAALLDDDADDDFTYQEAIIAMTAKSHGLYWLFVPGFGFLTKMCAYLNESPTWFLVGERCKEIEDSDVMPEIELHMADREEFDATDESKRFELKDGQGYIVFDGLSNGNEAWEFTFAVVDTKKALEEERARALQAVVTRKLQLNFDEVAELEKWQSMAEIGLDFQARVKEAQVLLEHVYRHSPADSLGMIRGDLAQSVNGVTHGASEWALHNLLRGKVQKVVVNRPATYIHEPTSSWKMTTELTKRTFKKEKGALGVEWQRDIERGIWCISAINEEKMGSSEHDLQVGDLVHAIDGKRIGKVAEDRWVLPGPIFAAAEGDVEMHVIKRSLTAQVCTDITGEAATGEEAPRPEALLDETVYSEIEISLDPTKAEKKDFKGASLVTDLIGLKFLEGSSKMDGLPWVDTFVEGSAAAASAAEEGGIQMGDLLIQVGKERVFNKRMVRSSIIKSLPGAKKAKKQDVLTEPLTLKVLRPKVLLQAEDVLITLNGVKSEGHANPMGQLNKITGLAVMTIMRDGYVYHTWISKASKKHGIKLDTYNSKLDGPPIVVSVDFERSVSTPARVLTTSQIDEIMKEEEKVQPGKPRVEEEADKAGEEADKAGEEADKVVEPTPSPPPSPGSDDAADPATVEVDTRSSTRGSVMGKLDERREKLRAAQAKFDEMQRKYSPDGGAQDVTIRVTEKVYKVDKDGALVRDADGNRKPAGLEHVYDAKVRLEPARGTTSEFEGRLLNQRFVFRDSGKRLGRVLWAINLLKLIIFFIVVAGLVQITSAAGFGYATRFLAVAPGLRQVVMYISQIKEKIDKTQVLKKIQKLDAFKDDKKRIKKVIKLAKALAKAHGEVAPYLSVKRFFEVFVLPAATGGATDEEQAATLGGWTVSPDKLMKGWMVAANQRFRRDIVTKNDAARIATWIEANHLPKEAGEKGKKARGKVAAMLAQGGGAAQGAQEAGAGSVFGALKEKMSA